MSPTFIVGDLDIWRLIQSVFLAYSGNFGDQDDSLVSLTGEKYQTKVFV